MDCPKVLCPEQFRLPQSGYTVTCGRNFRKRIYKRTGHTSVISCWSAHASITKKKSVLLVTFLTSDDLIL